MKKLLLVPILTILCFTVFSQGEIKNAAYVNVAWNRPVMNYGEIKTNNSPDNLYKFYRNEHSNFKHSGGSMEFGSSFYIHPTGFIKGFKAGVLVDFIDLGVNYMSFTDSTIQLANPTNFYDEITCSDLTARYSLNIGAIVTYSPVKKFYFDLYAKFRPTFGVNYFVMPMFDGYYDKISSNYESLVYNSNNQPIEHKSRMEDTGIGFGLNYSIGFNIRYSKVLLGAEWVMGSMKYKYNDINMDQAVYDQYLKAKIGFFFVD